MLWSAARGALHWRTTSRFTFLDRFETLPSTHHFRTWYYNLMETPENYGESICTNGKGAILTDIH